MKQQMSLFIWAAAILGATPVVAATNIGARAGSSANLSGMPATRVRTNINYQKYETRTTQKDYDAADAKNLYYTRPANRSALYKQYDSNNRTATKTVRTTRAETVRTEMKRKYYLAHPFYQPLKGKFGSVTGLSYMDMSYDFDINQTLGVKNAEGNLVYPFSGMGAKWRQRDFAIKEDLSFGITDHIAVQGMLQYDMYDYKFEFHDIDSSINKRDDSGLNLFGVGAKWRFVDNDQWIANVSGYFMRQKDISNDYVLELRGGYKVSRSTLYGLLRGWFIDMDAGSYGIALDGHDVDGNYAAIYIPYRNKGTAYYMEGGVGTFSVLDEDWTLNVEGMFGHYDWHNQFSILGAIGWQPNDWFALNLYAKVALYDSANDKKPDLYWYEPTTPELSRGLTKIGNVSLDNYSEMTVGLQAIFQF